MGIAVKRVITGGHLVHQLCSTVWLIQDGFNGLIDTGAASCSEELLKSLKETGIDPADIDFKLYTHLHMDHCWNHSLFPNAAVFISEIERVNMERMLKKLDRSPELFAEEMQGYLGFHEPIPSLLLRALRRFFIQDQVPQLILSAKALTVEDLRQLGIDTLGTAGHTAGHTSFRLKSWTDDYLFSGDALMNQESYKNGKINMVFNEDTEKYLRTKTELELWKGWICPGHGKEFKAGIKCS